MIITQKIEIKQAVAKKCQTWYNLKSSTKGKTKER